MATVVQSLQQVGDEIALCRYPGAVIETLHAAVRPTLNVLGAWRVPRRYEDWSAWRLNYNVFCQRDLPATFFDAWLAGAKENGQSAIAAMATREGGSFTWSECMREVNLSAKGRWVFDDLLFKYGMRDGFCCPIGPWILHYWSSKVLDLSPAMRRSLSWAALTAVDQLMKLTTKKRLDAALPASRLTDREREVLRMRLQPSPRSRLAEDHFARHPTRATPDLHNSASPQTGFLTGDGVAAWRAERLGLSLGALAGLASR